MTTPDTLPPVTPESIHAAQIQQEQDRRQVEREQPGVRIDDAGHVHLTKESRTA